MSIATIMDNAMSDLFNHVGETATYTPVSGAPLPCKVWVQNDVELQPFDFQGMAVEMKIISLFSGAGGLDLDDGYKMVGNAVPVELARIVANSIKEQLYVSNQKNL